MTTLEAQGVAKPDEPVMPRSQGGGRPQHLLVTLLGDYWLGHDEPLPSAGLVDLLDEFSVSATSARAALSRLTRRGLLQSSKSGRRTFYGLTPLAERTLTNGLSRILCFGAAPSKSWDGTWLVATFSIPEEQRDVRHVLRSRLRWQGFAPLYDGVWVSPRDDGFAIEEIVSDLGVETATLFRSSVIYPQAGRAGHPLAAWDVSALRDIYDQFVERFAPLVERIRLGQVTASEALVARTAVMDTWRHFPNLDPELPASQLPDEWPRERSREIFIQVYDGLGPLAEIRVQQIIAAHAPEIAQRLRHFTTSMALSRLTR
jgi:phenylacetic acid degradation operon negative regulatory protein